MKTIGIVDYYLSEYHANHYPEWIARASEELGEDYRVAYAWAEREISPVDGVSTDEWCAKQGALRCGSMEELCERADCVMILSPDDPDRHLPYAEKVLPHRKPTYIDKTFAPTLAEADAIFALAGRCGAKFFSTSSLRYAEELSGIGAPAHFSMVGDGWNIPVELIHLIEPAVIAMGAPARRIRTERDGDGLIVELAYDGGRSARLLCRPHTAYAFEAKAADGSRIAKTIASDFFYRQTRAILRFFSDGALPFDPGQTREAIRLYEAAMRGTDGEWRDL